MKNRPAGNPCERSGGIDPDEVRRDKYAEIVRMLRAGAVLSAIVARAGVGRRTVVLISRKEGLPMMGKPGPKRGRRGRPRLVPATVVQVVTNYRAQASHQRWGSALGGRWS